MKRTNVVWIAVILMFSSVFLPGSQETFGEMGDEDVPVTVLNNLIPSRNHLWKLDEIGGDVVFDSAGENHGLNNGAAINQPGFDGTCYLFDGTDDHLVIDHNDTLDFQALQDFNIFLWINTTVDTGRIMSKRQYPGDGTGYAMLIQDGQLGVYLDFGSTGVYIQGGIIIADGQWHHVRMMRNANSFEAYVDGNSIGSKTNAGGSISNTNPLLIGAEQDFWQYYTGYMDEITFIADFPPIADAGPDQSVAQHTLVTFDGTGSFDDVAITNYWWNFTDVTPQSLTGETPTYTFDNEGVFTVWLTVMDTLGQTGLAPMVVNVTDGTPPVADAGVDEAVTPGNIKAFDGTGSYDPGHLGEPLINGIVNWTWSFNDGTGPQTLWGPNPSHQFDIPGIYSVTLVVQDNAPAINGGPFTDNDTVNVVVLESFDIDISSAGSGNDWILMSYPSKISGHPFTTIIDMLDTGGGYVEWDIIRGWDNLNKVWITSAKFWPPSRNTFNYVDNTMAFWLHISSYGDSVISMGGDLATFGEMAIIPLYTGWNLIGYPFPVGQEMFNTFGILASRSRPVEVYDPSNPYGLRFADIWSEWHEPGGGYWVYVDFDEDLYMWSP
jgi:PKD repeat protein